jgi:hypothetical protein
VAILLQQAHETLGEAEEAWDAHYDAILEELEEETEGKLPGEDLRVSTARRRGGAQKWTTKRRAERMVKKLNERASNIKGTISALQSEGNLLREAV